MNDKTWMLKAELVRVVLKCAEVSGRADFVIIGSQAIHGTVADPDIAVVKTSLDIDLYPLGGYDTRNISIKN